MSLTPGALPLRRSAPPALLKLAVLAFLLPLMACASAVQPASGTTPTPAEAGSPVATATPSSSTSGDAATVSALQVAWILHWDKKPGSAPTDFRKVFADYYDFDAPVLLFDDFDPKRRTFRTVQDYADAFWPSFMKMRSAEHAVVEQPDVLLSGDMAATRMVFVAILTDPEGKVTATRATNSQVWVRGGPSGWHIARDQTGVELIPVDEARAAF